MAKLKATPKSFAEAMQVLAGRESMRLGNNTYLEYHESDGYEHGSPFVAVRLHATKIVIFHKNGRVTLHTGGYRTVTTKERINQFVDGRVFQKDFDWFYAYPMRTAQALNWSDIQDFEEGMVVSDPAWADVCPFIFNDIPCVLAKGHEGGHRSAQWTSSQTK